VIYVETSWAQYGIQAVCRVALTPGEAPKVQGKVFAVRCTRQRLHGKHKPAKLILSCAFSRSRAHNKTFAVAVLAHGKKKNNTQQNLNPKNLKQMAKKKLFREGNHRPAHLHQSRKSQYFPRATRLLLYHCSTLSLVSIFHFLSHISY